MFPYCHRGTVIVPNPNSHEIMVLFILRKVILQTHIRSHPVGLDVWCLVGPFLHFHTSYMRTAKALARLCGCAGSPELSPVACVIRTIISWAGSFDNDMLNSGYCARVFPMNVFLSMFYVTCLFVYPHSVVSRFSAFSRGAGRGLWLLIVALHGCEFIRTLCDIYACQMKALSCSYFL